MLLLILLLPLCVFVLWLCCLISCLTRPGVDSNQRLVWFLVIFFLPFIGSLIYLLAGPRANSQVMQQVAVAMPTDNATNIPTQISAGGGRSMASVFAIVAVVIMVPVLLAGGVIAMIAVPQFYEYRAKGLKASIENELRNAAFAQEAYYVSTTRYLSCRNETCAELFEYYTPDKKYDIEFSSRGDKFLGRATSKNDPKLYAEWDSRTGLVKKR